MTWFWVCAGVTAASVPASLWAGWVLRGTLRPPQQEDSAYISPAEARRLAGGWETGDPWCPACGDRQRANATCTLCRAYQVSAVLHLRPARPHRKPPVTPARKEII